MTFNQLDPFLSPKQIEVQRRKGEPIPEGWAIDNDGKMTTDPNVAMKGCLMPLGGPEKTSGYKGYGLAALVEIFCGISSGKVSEMLGNYFTSNDLFKMKQGLLMVRTSAVGWIPNGRRIWVSVSLPWILTASRRASRAACRTS